MPIFRTFAKRKEEAAMAGKPVIYTYDSLPEAFRVQVFHIWQDAIYPMSQFSPDYPNWWNQVHDILAKEMGVLDLVRSISFMSLGENKRIEQCREFLLKNPDVDQVLSLIELTFGLIIDEVVRKYWDSLDLARVRRIQPPEDAIQELNSSFQEHAIGYQYQAGQIIEVSSQYIHAEVVEPSIALLYETGFEGALEEFMTAHKHFREGNRKESIAQALNAFESTMKIICDHNGWDYSQKDTASKLLTVLFDNGLVPSQMLSHFSGLRAVLEGGVPTVRNNFGGHGQGVEAVVVPDYLVAYALHLTASNIVLLIEAYKSYNKDTR